jgi:hypothetical protein
VAPVLSFAAQAPEALLVLRESVPLAGVTEGGGVVVPPVFVLEEPPPQAEKRKAENNSKEIKESGKRLFLPPPTRFMPSLDIFSILSSLISFQRKPTPNRLKKEYKGSQRKSMSKKLVIPSFGFFQFLFPLRGEVGDN